MSARNKFEVNECGENTLLSSLKNENVDLFKFSLAEGQNPFIPSRYGQCVGGLLTSSYRDFLAIQKSDWDFDSNQIYTGFGDYSMQFFEHATTNPLTYTVPYLSGIHLAAAIDDCKQIQHFKDQAHALDAWGYTPMVYAVACCQPKAVTLLQELGGGGDQPVGSQRLNPLAVVRPGWQALPDFFAKKIPLPEVDFDPEIRKAQTIHQAAATGNLTAVQTLVEMGVPVDVRSFNGSTPLLCAALNKQKEVFDYLITKGASRIRKNYIGESAALFEQDYFLWKSEPDAVATESRVAEDADVNEDSKDENLVEDEDTGMDHHLREQFIDAALYGQFQSMVHLYFAIDDKEVIPKDLIENVQKRHLVNEELIVHWLYLKDCGHSKHNDKIARLTDSISEMTAAEVIGKGDKDYLLGYLMLHPSMTNAQINEPSLLEEAANNKMLGEFKWLLRHGVRAYINPAHLTHDLDPVFEYVIRDWKSKLKQEIEKEPDRIPDSLLFALTTVESEALRDYVAEGMSLETKTDYGLSLEDLAGLVNSSYLQELIKALPESIEPSPLDVNDEDTEDEDDEDVDDDFTPPSMQDSNDITSTEDESIVSNDTIRTAASHSRGEEQVDDEDVDDDEDADEDADDDFNIPSLGNLVTPETTVEAGKTVEVDEDDFEQADGVLSKVQILEYSHEIKPLVLKALRELPFPKLFIRDFMRVQDMETEEEFLHFVNDDQPTIELFRALKLYADEKAKEFMAMDN